MKKILYFSLVLALLLGATIGIASASGNVNWLPYQECKLNGDVVHGLGCWVNDCSQWLLSPVSVIPDSSGVTVTFSYTEGDFATGPHAGHITVGYGGSFAQPTYNQAATDTANPVFSGTVLDDVSNIPASSTYTKHFNLPPGDYTLTVYFGQEGCENCGQVVSVRVTVTHKHTPFIPNGTVWWTVDAIKRDPMRCHFAIYDGGQPTDANVLKICNSRLTTPLWFSGQWDNPHNYIEGTLDGNIVYKDGWTGEYVPWSTITYSDAWY